MTRQAMTLMDWASISLLISVASGALGFNAGAGIAAKLAKALFAVFLFIAVVLFVLVVLGVGAGH